MGGEQRRESSRERAHLTGRADGSWGGKRNACGLGTIRKIGEKAARRGTGYIMGQNKCARRNPEGRNGGTGEGNRMSRNPRGKWKSKPKKKKRKGVGGEINIERRKDSSEQSNPDEW